MICAIYARKSTEQTGVADEQKSVTRQIAHARQYAAQKGWTIADEHVFVDDGISGAEFANRPGFLRLMNAVKPRPAFQVLVMSEESRLGREAIETAYALKQVITAGVRVFFYLEDRERTLDSPTDKIMLSLTTFADELEREKARQRTYDAMVRKAKLGHCTGGSCFGYRNVRILDASGQRSHVVRQVNEAEAAVVRQIFEMSAAGGGLARICKSLNASGARAPRPQQGRPTGWAISSVRGVLLRPIYRGEIVWNKTRKRDRWGQSRRSTRPTGDAIRVAAPELQIVSDDLWTAAHARFHERQRKHDTHRGQQDVNSRFLLSGLSRCAVCGGGFAAQSRAHGKERAHFYGCTANLKRGAEICANSLIGRMDVLDAEVLATLRDDICRPAVIERAIRQALEALSPAHQDLARERLETDLKAARAECDRLAEAISRGGPLEALLTRLTARQAHCTALEQEIAACRAARPPIDVAGLERRLRAKLNDWRGLLSRNVEDGRAALRALLIGPLRFTPVIEERRRGYAFEGAIALDRLVAGIVDLPPVVASPSGKVHRLQVEMRGYSELRAA